jgi:hypothetical protein
MKVLNLTYTFNTRDLGGLKTKDNKVIKNNLLIRSGVLKKLSNEDIEFENILEHVLIPYSNNRFDAVNCLNQLGISKPNSFDHYYRYIEDVRIVAKLNNEIEKYEQKGDK